MYRKYCLNEADKVNFIFSNLSKEQLDDINGFIAETENEPDFHYVLTEEGIAEAKRILNDWIEVV